MAIISNSRIPFASPHHILVVDDEEIVLVALRQTLIRAGYQVSAVTSPLKALDLLRDQAFAAVISDQLMPGMLGLDFLVKVRELQPDAARILITAVLSLDTVIEAINKGEIYRFIVKPWLGEELLSTVKNAVHRYELLLQNAVLLARTLSMNEKLTELNASLEKQVRHITEENEQLKLLNEALVTNQKRSV